MKIYLLLSLIALIVGLSRLPGRVQVKPAAATPPDAVPAWLPNG